MNPEPESGTGQGALEARVKDELRARASNGLLRSLRAPAGVDLSSNDYLGLADHPLVNRRMIEAIDREGCGSGGSRLLRGHRPLFDQVERAFAALKQSQRALYFSSGYLANLAVLSTLPRRSDLILSDRLNHASLRDGIRLSSARRIAFPHNDVATLSRLLAEHRGGGQTFVVTESLFSMDGDVPPLDEYADVCRRAGALLVVDEAHAVGVCGSRGSGLLEAYGIPADDVVSVNMAGKALGVAGAFVTGPSWVIEYLIQCARPFVFSTAPPPAVAAALHASLSLVVTEPERRGRLIELASYFGARLADAGVAVPPATSHIIPIVIGDTDRAVAVAEAMQTRGFDVRAIRPPTVAPGTARLRISVNVGLTEAIIDTAVGALAAVLGNSAPRQWHAVSS